MNARVTSLIAGALLSPALSACGSKDSDQPAIHLVDPKDAYGMSYAEWAVDWVRYVNSVSPPECSNPLMSETGADCGLYQDEKSPAFFLVGNFGGVSIRKQCAAPAGKALFFPLIVAWGDNVGVPTDMLLSDDDIKAYIQSTFDLILVDSLQLSVDGQSLDDLASGAVGPTPYTLQLAPQANAYYCMGAEDVAGEFPGYTSGYWAMLPPLEPGSHVLQFGGSAKGTATAEAQKIVQTYHLTVE